MHATSLYENARRFCLAALSSSSAAGVHAQTPLASGREKIQPSNFRIVFRIENASDGSLRGVLYQPDQSTDGVVLTSVAFAKGELTVTQSAMDLSFHGKMSADGQTIDGMWAREGRRIR